MKIKFFSLLYDLVDTPNVSPTHFQATVKKGNNTFDSILADTKEVTEIKVFDDDNNVTAVYTGYSQRIAVAVYGDDNVSIELLNTDISRQIDSLSSNVNQIADVVTTHDEAIVNVGEEISALNDSQDTQDGAIVDLASAISELEG